LCKIGIKCAKQALAWIIVQSRITELCTNNRFCTKNTNSAQKFKSNMRRKNFIISAE
jgi:hypothetical protein